MVDAFWCIYSRWLLETMWQTVKLLNFIQKLIFHFSKFSIVLPRCFQSGQSASDVLYLEKGSKLYVIFQPQEISQNKLDNLMQPHVYNKNKLLCTKVSIRLLLSCYIIVNPFPHKDAFWCLCSRRLFENIVTKEEIAQNEQFLLVPQCFPLLFIGYPFSYRDFLFVDKIYSIKVVCCISVVSWIGLMFTLTSTSQSLC